MDRERLERAWAAGFFDGEGWAARRTRGVTARINQADPDGVPEVLARFRRAVGCGRVAGPRRQDGRIDLYSWTASSRRDVERVHEALAPWLGPAKTAQLAGALGRDLARAEPTDEVELRAWAAGFWDGEGSVYLVAHRSHAGYSIAEAALTQEGSPDGSFELGRFRDAVGNGRINGPYTQVEANGPIYRWKCVREDAIRGVMHTLLPFLGPVKRRQWASVARVIDAQSQLPRGNPAWGRRTTHCGRGHVQAGARVRPYRPRGGLRHRPTRNCLVCVREDALERRRKNRGGLDPPLT